MGSLSRISGVLVLVGVAMAAGCVDTGPQSAPGVLTVQVVSPSGGEGSALVSLFGDGIRDVTPLEGQVYSHRTADTVRVVVVADEPGVLRFRLAVADTTALFGGEVLQVADGDDRLRSSLTGYALEFLR